MILRHSKYLEAHTTGENAIKKYKDAIHFWPEFLKTRKATVLHKNGLIQDLKIPHKDGLLRPESGSRLPYGQMADLLVEYGRDILKKSLPISVVKTRLSAVIWLHGINGVLHESLKTMGKRHECLRTLESEELTLQKAIDCYYSVDFQLDGNAYWLSDKQLNDLDNRAWHKIKRDPLEAAFRVIYECVREAIYRPASVTLKNLKDTDIRFRMEDVKFGCAEDQIQHLDITIKERGKRGKMAKVRLKKWHYNPTSECKRGGLFNAMNIYLDLNPQNKMGPIAYPDGSPITYTRFAHKLRRWGSDAGIPFKVTPAALRRSTIRNFAHRVPETQLRLLAHNLSEETAKKYYAHLTTVEVADIRASVAAQYIGNSRGNKDDQKGSWDDNKGDKPKSQGSQGKYNQGGKRQMNDPMRGAEGIRKQSIQIFLFSVHQTHLGETGSLA